MHNEATEFFEADSVVLAVGMEPNRRLAQELEGEVALPHVDWRQCRTG